MAAIAVAPAGVGPEELTEEFLRRRTQLQAVIFRIVRSWDEAQALTQDCFVRAYRARHTFNGQASLGTWLTRIAINLAYEWLRRVRANFFSAEQPGIATELRSVKASGPSPEQAVAVRQQSEYVEELLHRLPPHHRLLIELRYLHDMSVDEIVERTGLSMTTVKARLNRARATLRKRAPSRKRPETLEVGFSVFPAPQMQKAAPALGGLLLYPRELSFRPSASPLWRTSASGGSPTVG